MRGGKRPAVRAASNLATIDHRAPFVQWFERVLRHLGGNDGLAESRPIEATDLPEGEIASWREWCPPRTLWLPLKGGDGRLAGGLWLARDTPWTDAERLLLSRLGDCYAHAWRGLCSGGRVGGRHRVPWLRRAVWAILAVLVAASMTVPVRQSVLAPAEVVAETPRVAAAPLDGSIREVLVRPNQPVQKGDRLFILDDMALKAEAALARANLDVARAELARARQGAFQNAQAKADVEVRTERLRLRQAELAHAEERLGRVVVRAEADGRRHFFPASRTGSVGRSERASGS